MSRTLFALCAISLAGCDVHLFPAAGGSGGADATWTGVQAVMSDNCYSCHAGPSGSGGIVLPDDITADLANLNEPSTAYDELVVPGDSATSVLWLAVSFDPSLTGMPLGQSAEIPDAHFIQEWIDAGASLD